MNRRPEVSVIMTVFNAEPHLSAALGSIFEQSYGDFELIVIDNASTDGSRERLESIEDARLRKTFLKFNFGRTAVLNVALNLAQGSFVANLDADDIAAPQRLKEQLAFLRTHDDVVLLGSGYRLIAGDGSVIGNAVPPSRHQELVDAFAQGNPFAHSTVMYRRSVALAVGGYDWSFNHAQDAGLWLRMIRTGRVATVPEALCDLRIHAGQLSSRSVLETSEAIRVTRMALRNPQMSDRSRLRGRVFLARAWLVWLKRWVASWFRADS